MATLSQAEAATSSGDLAPATRREISRQTHVWTGGLVTTTMRAAGFDRRRRSIGTPFSLFGAAAGVMARTGNVPRPESQDQDLELLMAVEPQRTAEILSADYLARQAIEETAELTMPPEPTGDSISDAQIAEVIAQETQRAAVAS